MPIEIGKEKLPVGTFWRDGDAPCPDWSAVTYCIKHSSQPLSMGNTTEDPHE
jgi:hypothetical protein